MSFPRATVLLLLLALGLLIFAAHPANAQAPDDSHDDDHDHDDHGDEHDQESRTTVDLKIMSLVVLFASGVAVNAVAIFVPTLVRVPSWVMVHLTCFSTGIFLVVGCLHILGEGLEFVSNFYVDERVSERYRPGLATAVGAYFFLLFLTRGISAEGGHDHGVPHSQTRESPDDEEPTATSMTATNKSLNGDATRDTSSTVVTVMAEPPPAPQALKVNAATPVEAPPTIAPPSPLSAASPAPVTLMLATILMLSVHALIEGTTLGIQGTVPGVTVLFLGIFLHSWAEALTVANVSGRLGFTPAARLLFGALAAAVCPIGIGIGWGIGKVLTKVAIGHLLCFSAGTFTFISMTELMPVCIPDGERNFRRCLSALLGASGMYAILIGLYNPEAHNH
jgi:zinc transporter ZupT